MNQKFNAKAENEREIVKQAGVRYPSNKDSIGIELVGDSFPKGPNIDQKKVKFEIVTDAQNESLRWLVEQLKKEYRIPDSEDAGDGEGGEVGGVRLVAGGKQQGGCECEGGFVHGGQYSMRLRKACAVDRKSVV